MSKRIEKLYQFPIFEQLKGLPEELVKFESETGLSLPDVFSYTFLPVFQHEHGTMVIGKMGDFYVVALQMTDLLSYELYENKQAFRLWATETVVKMQNSESISSLNERELANVKENVRSFLERIETLIEKFE